jgi:hypothetical protein
MGIGEDRRGERDCVLLVAFEQAALRTLVASEVAINVCGLIDRTF